MDDWQMLHFCMTHNRLSRYSEVMYDGGDVAETKPRFITSTGIQLRLLPLLSGRLSIFKLVRMFHRPVTLPGDTAGVCSLLPDSSRNTRTRIYGHSINAVFLEWVINPHLFSIDWFPSLNLTGWFIDWSLFMETQLGLGESALSCWTLLEKQEPGFMDIR